MRSPKSPYPGHPTLTAEPQQQPSTPFSCPEIHAQGSRSLPLTTGRLHVKLEGARSAHPAPEVPQPRVSVRELALGLGRSWRRCSVKGPTSSRTAVAPSRGADHICRYQDALGTDHAVAVQAKMWTGVADDGRLTAAVDQVTEAID